MSAFEYFSSACFNALANGEWNDIRAMLLSGSMTRGEMDHAARSFRTWQTEEANPDRVNLADTERDAEILFVNVVSPRSVEINAIHSKSINGLTYRAQLEWTLTKTDDGGWLISRLPSAGLFSRSTSTWILLES
jgi:hypothetical protein